MKKLFSTLLLLATICLPAMAQETTNKATNRGSNVEEATQEDYQQIMESKIFVAVDVQGKWLSKLNTTAKMIDPKQKLTDQASTVYTFFNTAEAIVNDLVDQANASK